MPLARVTPAIRRADVESPPAALIAVQKFDHGLFRNRDRSETERDTKRNSRCRPQTSAVNTLTAVIYLDEAFRSTNLLASDLVDSALL